MRFEIIVEGKTEKLAIHDFIKKWLDNQLSERVGIKQRIYLGGKFEIGYPKHVGKILGTDYENEIIGVIGLRDLYGMGHDILGNIKGKDRVIEKISKLVETAVNNNKFKMFFAVHEFEAWLLSNPTIFPDKLASEIGKLANSPEDVDFNKPPSKRLNEIYNKITKGEYGKTTVGRDLFDKLNPQDVHSKCPNFRIMLDTMEKMANNAGIKSKI